MRVNIHTVWITRNHEDLPCTTVGTSAGRRSEVPADFPRVNTTTMEEPLGKMTNHHEAWMTLETTPQPQFLVEPAIDPSIERLGRCCSRPKVEIQPAIAPVIMQRVLSSIPERSPGVPTDEWFFQTLNEAIARLEKTGSEKDSQRAFAARTLLYPTKGRAGRPTAPIKLGDPIVLAQSGFSSQSVSIGNFFWAGIDFGEVTQLGEKIRKASSEHEKTERNRCVILHLAVAYEWALQGAPGGRQLYPVCKP